jgi:formylglycine-generating enzyme required for sulfatase activity
LTCREPTKRKPPVAADRRFPDGLLQRVLAQPQLWQNVALLASDELMRQGEAAEVWALIDELCHPYMTDNAHATAVPVALTIARRENLFDADRHDRVNRRIVPDYERLLKVARQVLTDDTHFTPAERNLAGELLGRRPEHDTRAGVGCRGDGLPDIDWVEIPECDEQGRREFIYQQGKRRREPTFWMARYPVTYGQFQAFLDAKDGFANAAWWQGLAASKEDKAEPGNQAFKFWNHPRERVSWYDAIAFCRWLTAIAQADPTLLPPALRGRTDWRITLPTEWQWEKAARGFDGRRYPWGNEYTSGSANINETYPNVGPHYLQKTSAVGMYVANHSHFGVMELSGNVWEWCLNEYHNPDHIQETGDATRVMRGGSWGDFANDASALFRFNDLGDFRNYDYGFRCVVVVGGVVPVM